MSSSYAALAGPAAFAVGAAFAYVSPNMLRTRARRMRRLLAALTAVVAVFSDAAPTGVTVVDALYRAAFAYWFVWLSSRARRGPLTIGALAAAAASWPHLAGFTASCTAVGLVLSTGFVTKRSPMTAAVAGALTVVGLLNGAWPDVHGGSAFMAVIAAVSVMASGLDRSPPEDRTRAWRVVLFALGLAVVGSALFAVAALQMRPALAQGVDGAHDAVARARRGDVDALDRSLQRSEEGFAEARRWSRSPLVVPAYVVPVLAQHVKAVAHASDAGHTLAERGRRTVAVAEVDQLQVEGGGLDLGRLEELANAMTSASTAVADAHESLQRARSPWLAGPLQHAITAEDARVVALQKEMRAATRVVERLPGFLGADGPRRYFLAVQTPAETRAAGGLLGNFGELVAEDGRLRLERFGRSLELNRGGDPAARTLEGPDDYVARYAKFQPATTWQNVTMSPDFPSVAEVIGHLYPQSGGRPVDGVVTVDPTSLAALLRLTGPIDMPGWGRLNARNAERVLYHNHYVRFANDEERREEFLGDVAESVTRRLISTDLGDVRRLIDVVGPVVRGRHLMFSTNRPEERALLDDMGLSGGLSPVRGDYVHVVTQNAAGNKIDYFLRRSISYESTVARDGSVSATLVVRLRNEAPTRGLPRSVIGSATDPPLPVGMNRLYFSAYSPFDLVDAQLDGQPLVMESERERSRQVHSAFIDVPAGGEVTVKLELSGTVRMPYRLDIDPQPLVVPDRIGVGATTAEGSSLFQQATTLAEGLSFRS